jgi:DNA-binding NarL/FixJ family response regulator
LQGNNSISVVSVVENGMETLQLLRKNESGLAIPDILIWKMNGNKELKKISPN